MKLPWTRMGKFKHGLYTAQFSEWKMEQISTQKGLSAW